MKTHLITGAGSGIGAAVADALYGRGDQLVVVARSEGRGAELLARWPGSVPLVADLRATATLAETLRSVGLPAVLDSVVHSAGVGDLSPIRDAEVEMWDSVLAINLVAPALLTAACLPALRAGGGTVVFINSGAGLTSHPGWSPYSSSKFGLKALADSLRGEEGEHGVRVTTVYPGRTATRMQESLHEYEGTPYDPARWIQPETVATAVVSLIDLTPDASIPDISIRPR